MVIVKNFEKYLPGYYSLYEEPNNEASSKKSKIGVTNDPMKLYSQFRGAEPSTEPMLKRKGLI